MEHPERVLMIECLDFYPFYHSELHWRIGLELVQLVGKSGVRPMVVHQCNGAIVQCCRAGPAHHGALVLVMGILPPIPHIHHLNTVKLRA